MNKIINFAAMLLGNSRRAALLLALVSAASLAAAYFFQFVIKLLPCELCYWQRKPHMLIIALGLLAAFLPAARARCWVLILIALTALVGSGIAFFHVGVEYHWWAGLTTCSLPTVDTRTLEEARAFIFSNSIIVPCDEPAWVFLGLSMAAWNGLLSLGLALVAAYASVLNWTKRS